MSATPSDVSMDTPVIPGLGICPSSRGSQSWADPDNPSSVAPGKRPRLTPSPALALMNDGRVIPFGTPGATVIGKTDGMTQFDATYKLNFINQNGAAVGQLVSVSFTEEGFVIANYNNGESQSLFKIPIADFSSPDSLQAVSGNAYTQTNDSGEANLREAGTSGAGKFQSSALETSNVELADQLTDMIVAQRAYQANTKVISTTDQLLSQLNDILR